MTLSESQLHQTPSVHHADPVGEELRQSQVVRYDDLRHAGHVPQPPELERPPPERKLPPEEDGTWYIVSSLTAQACPERKDFLIPGPAVRDEQGRIVACLGLCCL